MCSTRKDRKEKERYRKVLNGKVYWAKKITWKKILNAKEPEEVQ